MANFDQSGQTLSRWGNRPRVHCDEPTSRIIVRIWEAENGQLIYTSDKALMMVASILMNYIGHTRQIHDA